MAQPNEEVSPKKQTQNPKPTPSVGKKGATYVSTSDWLRSSGSNWNSVTDRLMSSQSQKTGGSQTVQQRKPSAPTVNAAPPAPPKKDFFEMVSSGEYGYQDAQASEVGSRSAMSRSDVLRDKEVASRIGQQSYIQNTVRPQTVAPKPDDWGVSSVFYGNEWGNQTENTATTSKSSFDTKFGTEQKYAPDGRPLMSQPFVTEQSKNDWQKYGLGIMSEKSIFEQVSDEWNSRMSRVQRHPLYEATQPNAFEQIVMGFLPDAFLTQALAQKYDFQRQTAGAGNSPVNSGNLALSLTPLGLWNYAKSPQFEAEKDKFSAELIASRNAIGSSFASSVSNATNSDWYLQRKQAIVNLSMENGSGKQLFDFLVANGTPEIEARSRVLEIENQKADSELAVLAYGSAVFDNSKDIIGSGFMATGNMFNMYYGSFEGGEAVVDAAIETVSTMNTLTMVDDAMYATDIPGTSYSLLEYGAMTREAAIAASGYILPLITAETTQKQRAVLSAAGGNAWNAWQRTASEIDANSQEKIDALMRVAIDSFKQRESELRPLVEQTMVRLRDRNLSEEQRSQIELNSIDIMTEYQFVNGAIDSLSDYYGSQVSSNIHDLEKRMETAQKYISDIEEAKAGLQSSVDLYKNIIASDVPFTSQDKWSRDQQLSKISEDISLAFGTLYQNPQNSFSLAYDGKRFWFDILAPSFLADMLPKVKSAFGAGASAFAARATDAANVSGVSKVIDAGEITASSGAATRSAYEAGIAVRSASSELDAAIDIFRQQIAKSSGTNVVDLAGKSLDELNKFVEDGNFPALGKEFNDAKSIVDKAMKKAEDAAMAFGEKHAEYIRLVEAQADRMFKEIDEQLGVAENLGKSIDEQKPGRQTQVSTLYRSAKSAASAVVNETHRAVVDVFMHVNTKEDAIQILSAMKDPSQFLKGVDGVWSSPVLFKGTLNGTSKFVFNAEPWLGKNAQRGLKAASRNMDDFIETMRADLLKGTGTFSKDIFFQEFDHFVEAAFARDTWSATERARLPFGTAGAKVKSGKGGGYKVIYFDRNNTTIREVVAPDASTANKTVAQVNASVKGDYFKQDPISAIGNAKRQILAVPFIGWNPANLIQQMMHPVINTIFQVDGVSVFGKGRWGLRTLSEIEEHVMKLFGTENPTRRHGSTDFRELAGLGTSKNKTIVEKVMRPLGDLYVWVEEGSGKQFYYDAAVKFIQKYGRQIVDKVLEPNLIAEGVDPLVAKKASKTFFDVAYREGYEAGAEAALAVIDGNITRYTMSDFDTNWASWMHPNVAREIEEILNSSLSITDVDKRINTVVNKFDEAMSEFDVTSSADQSGTRHAFTQADRLQDVATLKHEMNAALNSAPTKLKPTIKAEFQQVVDLMKQNDKALNGLISQISSNALPNVGNVFYHIWQAMRDGRAKIAFESDELAAAIHLAGGKQKWATDYWPKVKTLWQDYYNDIAGVISKTKEAVDNGDVSGLARAEDLIVEHSRHTDDFLRNQLNIEPGSGQYDNSLRVVMEAARAIERNQQGNFASVALRSKASPSRIFDEAISAERDIAIQKVQIRGKLNKLSSDIADEVRITGNKELWNDYFTQRNALWRWLFSDYVPTRWQEAMRSLFRNEKNSDALLQEILATIGNVTPERASEMANNIRKTLSQSRIPSAKVVGKANVINAVTRVLVDKTALFDEIVQLLEQDAVAIRTTAGETLRIEAMSVDNFAKTIRNSRNGLFDIRRIRQIEDASGNVIWDAQKSNAWIAASKTSPPLYKTGQSLTWRAGDIDTQVVIVGVSGQKNGEKYYKVSGSSTNVPESQLIPNVGKSPSAGISFETEKGSSYVVGDDGSTTRNKAARPEHPGDSGIKPKSFKTYYVSEDALNVLSEIQARNASGKRIVAESNGKIGVMYTSGKDSGKFESRTLVDFSNEPAIGLHPVEVWQDGTTHFGNKIVSISRPDVGKQGGIQSSVPPVNPALEGVYSLITTGTGTPGWLNQIALLDYKSARNIILIAMNKFEKMYADAPIQSLIQEMNDNLSDIRAQVVGMRQEGESALDFVWREKKNLSVNSQQIYSAPQTGALRNAMELETWWDSTKERNFERAIEDAFEELYGTKPSDTIAAISSPSLEALPQVTPQNVASKIAKAFDLPVEMADGLASIIEAFANRYASSLMEDSPRFAEMLPLQQQRRLAIAVEDWYKDAIVDIVYSDRMTPAGVAAGRGVLAQTEVMGNAAYSSQIIRTFENLMNLNEQQRLRVAIHETWHLFHNDLIKQASEATNVRAQEMVVALYEYFSGDTYYPGMSIDWRPEYMERVATAGEEFVSSGVTKIKALQPVFEKFKSWLEKTTAIYRQFRDWLFSESTPKTAGKVSEKVETAAYKLFEEMLGGQKADIPSMPERYSYTEIKPYMDSPEFKRWFEGSKITNDRGVPTTMYHGTPNGGFTEFDPEYWVYDSLYGPGFYFTSDSRIAGGFFEDGRLLQGYAQGKGVVYPVHLSIKNPFDIRIEYDAKNIGDARNILESFYEWIRDEQIIPSKFDETFMDVQKRIDSYDSHFNSLIRKYDAKNGIITNHNVYKDMALLATNVPGAQNQAKWIVYMWMKKHGYDGIVHVGGAITGNEPHFVAIAFEPEQIKSAIANVGTYSKEDANILRASGNVPNVGKQKTTPDVAYMNMIRDTAKRVFPELFDALKNIDNLRDVPMQLMPLVQQMANIKAIEHEIRGTASLSDAEKSAKLQKTIDESAQIYSAYSPELRESIRSGNIIANSAPNAKSPSPNTSAMYSIEQLQSMRSKIVDELRSRSDAANKANSPRPQIPGADVPAVPPNVKMRASELLYKNFRREWDKVLNGANIAGDTMRSFTMTDFWNRTRADDFLQLISPFPFWSTRDIKNGFERMMRNPSFAWHTYRIEQGLDRAFESYNSQQERDQQETVPLRYKSKMGVLGAIDVKSLPSWAQGMADIVMPGDANGTMVPTAVFWPLGLSRFFPTNMVRLRNALESGRSSNTDNQAFDFFATGGMMAGLSFDPWISESLSVSSGQQPQYRVADWTIQTRNAAWFALQKMHPRDWMASPSALRPDWYEFSVARELENMVKNGALTDRMTLGLAMDYLYRMQNNGQFNSPEWNNATPEQQQSVWNALTSARDVASSKIYLQSGTGILTGFPVYLYDKAEGKTNWEQKVRSGLYYDPMRNPLGSNESANYMTSSSLPLQAADMKNKIVPRNGVAQTPSPIVMASTSQRREDIRVLDESIKAITSSAVSELLASDPRASSSEMNEAKVNALIPEARKILGDEAVDKWIASEKGKLTGNNKRITNFGGIISMMREQVSSATPSAYSEASNSTSLSPEGTPRRYMQDNLAYGSPWSTLPENQAGYSSALARFPSPENPDMLRSQYVESSVELVVDLYKYPAYGTVSAREYAQQVPQVDEKRAEHLARLLKIPAEEAKLLLNQYKYRYMGEDEIARRTQMEEEGYSSYSGGRGNRNYRRGGRGYSRGGRSYSRGGSGGWGGGGSWNGSSQDVSGETDLLPSIESYINRRNGIQSNLWTRVKSRYSVR